MVNLHKSIERELKEIFEKYQKEVKFLNYLIVGDEITFFLALSNDKDISKKDLCEISDIIKGEYISTETVNQEYRIKFKYGL